MVQTVFEALTVHLPLNADLVIEGRLLTHSWRAEKERAPGWPVESSGRVRLVTDSPK